MSKKEFTLTNFNISKVTPGPSGERGGTPWQILRLEVDHAKAKGREFTKFVNPQEPENHPYVGAPVKEMSFTVKKSGDFMNYTIGKIIYEQQGRGAAPPHDGSKHTAGSPQPNNTPNEEPSVIPKSVSVCVSYVKDLMVAGIRAGKIDITQPDLPLLVDQVTRQGVLMYRDIIKYLQSDEEVPSG